VNVDIECDEVLLLDLGTLLQSDTVKSNLLCIRRLLNQIHKNYKSTLWGTFITKCLSSLSETHHRVRDTNFGTSLGATSSP